MGDKIQLEATELEVVGIVDGHSVVENGAMIMSLKVLQDVMVEPEGKINFVDVRLDKNITKEKKTDEVKHRQLVKKIFPEGRASLASEVVGTSQGFRVARAMSWSTSLLAIVVGVLGVMNTMLMTVFERTHEIGILLAVGWKRMRIVYMVLCESALLGFFGGVAGVAIGALGLKIMQQTPHRPRHAGA